MLIGKLRRRVDGNGSPFGTVRSAECDEVDQPARRIKAVHGLWDQGGKAGLADGYDPGEHRDAAGATGSQCDRLLWNFTICPARWANALFGRRGPLRSRFVVGQQQDKNLVVGWS